MAVGMSSAMTEQWLRELARRTKLPLGVVVRRADLGAASHVLEQARVALIERGDVVVIAARAWIAMLRRGAFSARPHLAAEVAAELILQAAGWELSDAAIRRVHHLAHQATGRPGSLGVEMLAERMRTGLRRREAGRRLQGVLDVLAVSPVRRRSNCELERLTEWAADAEAALESYTTQHGLLLRWNRLESEIPLDGEELELKLMAALAGPPALVVMIDDGHGATGVGMVAALAGARARIICVKPAAVEASACMSALRSRRHVTVTSFDRSKPLADALREVLDQHHPALLAASVQSTDGARWLRLGLEWRAAFADLSADAQERVVERSGLMADHFLAVLFDPAALATCELGVIERIGQLLNRPLAQYAGPEQPAGLSRSAENRLRLIAREEQLSTDEVLDLRGRGEREMLAANARKEPDWAVLLTEIRRER